MYSSRTARQALLLAIAALVFTSVLAVAFSIQVSGLQDRTVRLEKRIADLECRHILFEDGSTKHSDGEVTVECVYTAPVFAKHGN